MPAKVPISKTPFSKGIANRRGGPNALRAAPKQTRQANGTDPKGHPNRPVRQTQANRNNAPGVGLRPAKVTKPPPGWK